MTYPDVDGALFPDHRFEHLMINGTALDGDLIIRTSSSDAAWIMNHLAFLNRPYHRVANALRSMQRDPRYEV